MLITKPSKYTHIDLQWMAYVLYGTVDCEDRNKFKVVRIGQTSIYTKEEYDRNAIKRIMHNDNTSINLPLFIVSIIRSRHSHIIFKKNMIGDTTFVFASINKI